MEDFDDKSRYGPQRVKCYVNHTHWWEDACYIQSMDDGALNQDLEEK